MNKLFYNHAVIVFFLLLSSFCKGWAQPVIFNASPTALPGEAVSLQGSFGATTTAFLATSTSPMGIALPVLVQSAGQLSVQIPTMLVLDVYQIWVQDGQQQSAPVYINQALGMQFDSPEVMPGGTMRLFGRNLRLSGGNAQVRFVAQSGNVGEGGQATINVVQSNAYTLYFTVPTSLQAGEVYNVFVTNGRGGSAGETKVPQSIRAIAAGVDYFQLGVPWAAKFSFYQNVYNVKTDSRLAVKAVGNGIADDQAAIQAAIMQASQAGGGIVYLPAGTYKLFVTQGEGLTLYTNVVLRGAGPQNTFVKYGYGAAGFKFGLVFYGQGQKMGLADLTLENVNEQGQWIHNMYVGYPGQVSDVFLSNVHATYSGEALTFSGHPSRLLLKDCHLISKYNPLATTNQGPLAILAAEYVTLTHNYIQHEVNQTIINDDVHDLVAEQNTFVRDCAIQYKAAPVIVETRTLSINFAKNVVLLANHFESVNGQPKANNDGETILNEGGAQQRRDAYYGAATAATSTTLQDNTVSWASLTSNACVAIIYGRGQGQIRKVIGNTAQSLTLERAWDVVPDTSSHYSITTFSAENWLIKDNTLLNNKQGIMLFGASSRQVAIVNNKLTSNGGIWLRPGQEIWNGMQVFNIIYNTQVVGNTVENLGSVVPAFIGIVPYQYAAPVTMGTGAIGIEMRNNTVQALPSYVPTTLYGVIYEGYCSFFQAQFSGQNGRIPMTLGTIFQNNTAINCQAAIYLNSGSYNTVVCRTSVVNVGKLLQDEVLPNCSHASVNTALCTTTTQPGTGNQRPVADPKLEQALPGCTVAVPLVSFTGFDPDGWVTCFKITTLPPASLGTLYLRGKAIGLADSIRSEQADSLIFQPATSMVSTVSFQYAAIDNQRMASQVVPFVIRVDSPLPVELTSFLAKTSTINALLTWTTASEENTAYFAVERSFDGVTFAEIGRVQCKANKIGANYMFTDQAVGTLSNKIVYYRLRQVDTNSSLMYSPLRTVDFTGGHAVVIQMYPNPVASQLHVLLPSVGARCAVYSSIGKLLFEQYTATKEVILDMTGLQAQTYFLLVHTDDGTKQWLSFVKQQS